MRLIDADSIRVPKDEPYAGALKRLIEQQPTAYDVDKVVEQLEEMRNGFNKENLKGEVIGVVSAINVVKADGLSLKNALKKTTEADRIRSISDEELAKYLMNICKDDFVSVFCSKSSFNAECESLLDDGKNVDSLCIRCCVEWLQSKAKEH